MGKKKFIDAKSSETYHVVHRSQQDKTKEYDHNASEFVLVPTIKGNQARKAKKAQRAEEGGVGAAGGASHINALGLPNDGYDYERHFKTMGGGTFVSSAGRVGAGVQQAGGRELPEEALPSEETLERQLEAITISEQVMERDMRSIIFDGADEWEEMDDDFCLQAAQAPPEPGQAGGFNYDAHIAKLMAQSEEMTGVRLPQDVDGAWWTELSKLKHKHDESDPDDDDDSGHFDEAFLLGQGPGPGEQDDEPETELTAFQREVVTGQFEAALLEYDSDEQGAPEWDDEEVEGFRDVTQDAFADECMNEFLEENRKLEWGGEVGAESVAAASSAAAAARPLSGGEAGEVEEEEAGQGGDDDDDDDGDGDQEGQDDDILSSFNYMVKKTGAKWDCETIVSTYSNLDNRPKVLKVESTGKRKPRGSRQSEQSDGASGNNPAFIRLSNKTGLPMGVMLQERPVLTQPREEQEHEPEDNVPPENRGKARQKGETAEEKRARKASLKEQKRDKRASKKETQAAYKAETKVAHRLLGSAEAGPSRTVYSYT